MSDIETSVAITARTEDLQSGMQTAANSVESATEAMKAQFFRILASLPSKRNPMSLPLRRKSDRQLARCRPKSREPSCQLGTAGSVNPIAGATSSYGRSGGISVTQTGVSSQSSGRALKSAAGVALPDLQSQLSDEQAFFADSKAEELAFWQDKLALTQAGSKEQLAVENNIYQLEKAARSPK